MMNRQVGLLNVATFQIGIETNLINGIFSIAGKKHALSYTNEEDGTSGQVHKCENCGNAIDEQNIKLKKEKRFCSPMCAKRYICLSLGLQ